MTEQIVFNGKSIEIIDKGIVKFGDALYISAKKIAELELVASLTSRPGVHKRAVSDKWASIKGPGAGAKDGVDHYLIPGSLISQDEIQEKINSSKLNENHLKKSSLSVKEEVLQYDSVKEYQQVVVKLNAKQRRWLEAICSNFAAVDDEQEQQKMYIYSTDLYDKKVNTNKKRPEFVSGIVERTMESTPHDRRSKIKKFRKSKNPRTSKLSKR